MQKYLLYLSMAFTLSLSACGSDAPQTEPTPDPTTNVTTNPENQPPPTTAEPQEAPDFGAFF